MSSYKALNRLISILMVLSLLFNGSIGIIQVSAQEASNPVTPSSTSAMPVGPTDESKVPHYFGPWPNWANSPFTLPNATVSIQGDGSGAEAVAQVNPVTQGIDSIQVTAPGSGYTYANVFITGGNNNAAATATINTTGVVTSVNIDAAGGGYSSPQVSFSGGGATGTLVSVGNPLTARANATDFYTPPTPVPASVTPIDMVTFNATVGSAAGGTFTLTVDAATTAAINWNAAAADVQTALANAGVTASVTGSGSSADPWVIVFPAAPATVTIDGANLTQPAAPALVPVFVVVPATMPANGIVQKIQYFNQATPGGSPSASAGNKFHVYILHPTGIPNEYNVIWDSGQQTVPTTTNPSGVIVNVQVNPGVAVTTGDVIAFYGAGIPYDAIVSGADIRSTPAPTPPSQGGTITLGSAGFPIAAEARTYSLGAQVLDQGAIPPMTSATGTAYGGVDAVQILDGGSNYTMPTVDFDMPDDPNGTNAKGHALMDSNGTITNVIVDDPGSGYLTAPGVTIHNGTQFDPIAGAALATVTSTLKVTSVTVDTFGSGYVSAPNVVFSDATGAGTGASATASVNVGGVTNITMVNPGSGYLNVGMRKFIDDLPGLCAPPSCPLYTSNPTAKYIPLAVPEAKKYNGIEADEYVIGLVQYRTSFSSDLPPTLVRGYVQLETPSWLTAHPGVSQHFPLRNELLNGTFQDTGYVGVTPPQWLGPIIVATKDKPVRIVFRNLLPTGSDGDLFLPVDSSMMGSGMGPMMMMDPMNDGSVMDEVRNPPCTEYPKGMGCFKDNRATLHLHGGNTPWISDGTAHQWITPAGETTDWPQGVSVSNVPDMGAAGCDGNRDGCMTFYYTNQQSARLLFYHDHAWGITRLNVYAGEAAGYLITDATEQALVASGTIPADQIPLIVQDRTFVPDAAQLALQDPTWDVARWGSKGSFWYHHVYMPAQNPGDPSGMSAYGRWMYGPWFWPPAASTVYGPIDNPYYDANCKLDDPATWQYQTDPFCEPEKIPGTPNISVGMEQFNDTPVVNGVAYPKVTLEPKAYRLRILNAANDRFWNLQWYIADPTQGNGLTEVALKQSELDAAQTDPNVFPTPDTSSGRSPVGPSWIQIGTEGGFLPAPVVIPNQPITWITDPTRFDVGNVDQHSLLLAPAERADVIVDFSRFAGKTLILYNDAPAAFPARVSSYDYYTGAPDLSPVGAPTILPGYGPNTRTIMQVTIAGTAAPAFNLTKLRNAFKHNAAGTGVFESGQHPIIVGQAAYNSAYGTSFAASSNCNALNSTTSRCDGFVRVDDTTVFGFNTLRGPNTKLTLPLQPKAIHDEMNSSTFDEYGRMTANLGVEAQPPSPGAQNVTLYPFVNPGTELIDGTNLPKMNVIYDANGLPVNDIKITAIGNTTDGTQLWRITHNGVDTHPIHFHLYDVQLVNRVTWDNIIIPPDPNELGWKDTVRVSPLEDTIFAIRPVIPQVPWELPNAIRMLNPMMPANSQAMFNNIDPQGNPTNPITNQLVNFGWEYVYHCHILSHEEMDMMRPVSVVLPPNKPTNLNFDTGTQTLTWNDNSINETSFEIQRATTASNWQPIGTVLSPLDQPNIHEPRSYVDATFDSRTAYRYRVVAKNTVGYGAEFPSLTAQSISDPLAVGTPLPPVVSSIVRASANPTNASSVSYTVTFSEDVTGVDTTDFNLNVAGVTGASVTGVTGTGASYTVTANTGSGDGTLRLDVIDDNSILNGFSVPLGGPVAGDGNYSAGESYTMDKTRPTVSSIVRSSINPSNAATVWYTVTFSEPVTAVDTADFAVSVTGGITGASVTSVAGTGATRSVAVSTGKGTGTISLSMPGTATVTDMVGNSLAGLPISPLGQEYTIYLSVPTVVSIVRASTNPTNAASVDYTVTFSEPVTGVDTTDFAITSTGGITGASVTSVVDPTATGTTYTVSLNTGNGSGTIRLDLMDNNSIQNALPVPLGGAGTQNYMTGEVYTLDKTVPIVVSIARASPNPTNAASVDFTVTFSEPVTGVVAGDFVPTMTGGVTGASVTNLSQPNPAQPVYRVTVDTGTGTGTIRLDLMDNDTIIDNLGNPLGGVGVNNYTIGEIYDIDKTPPTIVSVVRALANPTNAASVDYTVTFSEPVTGVDSADFDVVPTGIAGASVASVTGTGATYTVSVNTGTGDGTLRLDVPGTASVADLVGNAITGLPFTSGEVYDVDKTPPTVVSIVRASVSPTFAASVDYTVTFSEPVTGVDATDFAFTVTGGIANPSVTGISGSGTTYTVTVDTGTGDGTLRLDLMDNDSIIDAATNPLGGAGANNYTASDVYDIDKTPPSVVSIVRTSVNPTFATNVGYTVTFSEPVTGVDTTDFILTVTGGVTNPSIISVTGTGTTYNVAVNTGTGDGTLRLDLIDDNSIMDAATNPLGGAGANNYTASDVYDVDKTPPSVVSIARASVSPTNATSVDYTVTFSEAVTGVDAADFALNVTGVTGASITNVTGSGAAYTVSINSGTGSGTLRLDMPNTASIADLAANPLGGLPVTSGEVYTLDKTAPTVVSVVRASANPTGSASISYTVTFSEPVTGVDAADFALTLTGATTASIASVNGSDAIYTVAVDNGIGKGTLRLDLAAGASVNDLVGNALGGLPYTGGQVYTTAAVVSVGTYDDADPAWTYTGTWLTSTTTTGAASSTLHYANANNTSATFVFQGPARFVLTYSAASNRGNLMISVDGGAPVAVNAYSATTRWQRTYSSALYTDTGRHTVTFSTPNDGKYIDVDAIQILAAATPMGVGTYDDTDPAWSYLGSWTAYTGSGPVGNSLHYTNANNASATFTFQAPARFILTYTAASNRGNILVSVDGGAPVAVNAYSATTRWQRTYSSALYSDAGIHTVTITTPGDGKYVDVDSLQILAAPTAVGTGTYEDTDPALTYTGAWTAYTGNGPTNNTMQYTNASNATAMFAFQGPGSFILTYTAAPTRGNILISVDGGVPIVVNAYSATTVWKRTYKSGLYPAGIHIVTIGTPTNGTYIDVDAIQILPAPPAVGAGTYDDTDPAWTFGGGWTTYTGSGPYNGTDRYSNVVGSDAQLSFTGTQFTLTYVKASNRGSIDVYVDGVKVGTINAANGTTVWQATWTSPTFSAGTHLVRFVHAGGGTYIDVDAITITP